MHQGINSAINASMMSDDLSEPSSPEDPGFDDSDLLHDTVHDDVTAQLAAAGKVQVLCGSRVSSGWWHSQKVCLIL